MEVYNINICEDLSFTFPSAEVSEVSREYPGTMISSQGETPVNCRTRQFSRNT